MQTERCFHEELPLCVAIFFNVCISKIKPPELDSIEKCILIALDIFISMVIIVVIEQTKKKHKKNMPRVNEYLKMQIIVRIYYKYLANHKY